MDYESQHDESSSSSSDKRTSEQCDPRLKSGQVGTHLVAQIILVMILDGRKHKLDHETEIKTVSYFCLDFFCVNPQKLGN